MPELPEVETVARDLRPRLVGATIVGARQHLGADARDPRPRGVRGGRLGTTGRRGRPAREAARHRPVRGCGADDPPEDDRAAVRRAQPTTPEDAYIRLVLELADGRELRFRDIRKFGRVGLYGRDPVTERARHRGRGRRSLCGASDRSPSTRRSRVKRLPTADPAPHGPPQAACSSTSRSLPVSATSTRTRRSGRRDCTRCEPRPRSARRTNDGCTGPSARSWRRPSSGAAARSTTTPRPTATARCRSDWPSTSGPGSRARAAAARSSGSSSVRACTHFCSWCQRLPAA